MHTALHQPSAYAVPTELRSRDGIKAITYYAGLLPAKRQKYLPPLYPLKFKLQTRPSMVSSCLTMQLQDEEYYFNCIAYLLIAILNNNL